MRKENMTIWGREFELEIEFDCYPGETILPIQEEALTLFLNMKKEISDSEKVVKEYYIRHYSEELAEHSITNIFKYVMPKCIFIKRNPQKHIVALLCNDKFNIEHGMALVFEEKKLFQIGTEDIIL